MTRSFRARPAGVFFYAVLFLMLACSAWSIHAINSAFSATKKLDALNVVIAVGVAVAAVLTSDAAGFAFGAVHALWWNRIRGLGSPAGGFSREWARLDIDVREALLAAYQLAPEHRDRAHDYCAIASAQHFTTDVLVSYAWQQAPQPLVDWTARRFTVFFASSTSALGLSTGVVTAAVTIFSGGLGWTWADTGVTIGSACLVGIFLANGRFSKREAVQMIDLWLRASANPALSSALAARFPTVPRAGVEDNEVG